MNLTPEARAMTPEEFETRFLNLDVICQTRAEMIVAYRALWERERDNSDYISALCRAIESHCRGVAVPDDTAARCPYHAKMLNEHRMTEIGPTSETNAADSDVAGVSEGGEAHTPQEVTAGDVAPLPSPQPSARTMTVRRVATVQNYYVMDPDLGDDGYCYEVDRQTTDLGVYWFCDCRHPAFDSDCPHIEAVKAHEREQGDGDARA